MKKCIYLFFIILTITSIKVFHASAQHMIGDACMMLPISLEDKTKKAALIVEGHIVDSYVKKDPKNNTLYTYFTISVATVFKGDKISKEITAKSPGGKTEEEWHIITGSLNPTIEDQGIFFLTASQEQDIYEPLGAVQGLIKFTSDGEASDGLRKYKDTEQEIRQRIEHLLGKSPTHLQKRKMRKINPSLPGTPTLPVIQSFSPTNISAGTDKVLTIKGSGFGSIRGTGGKVEFRNCNDGGSTWVSPSSISYTHWSDTEIRVKVPSSPCAGTGNIRVTNASGASTISTKALLVNFSYINIEAHGITHIPVLTNTDNRGGHSFRLNVDFDENEPAKEAFYNALIAWRCNTGVNFKIGNTTTNNTSEGDGENVVRFALPGELPEGVLGRCLTRLSNCHFNNWYVVETDLEFSSDINWSYSAGRTPQNQIDFESVAIHELGHAHLIGHVIKHNAVMHHAIGFGQQRRDLIEEVEVEAGNYVLDKSGGSRLCGPGNMTPLAEEDCEDPEGPFEYVNNKPGKDKPVLIFYNYRDDELVIAISGMEVKNTSLRISNINGQIIDNIPINTENGEFYTTKTLTHLPQAMYLYSLFTDEEKYAGKFIIQK
ncbi:matrixin family metalloprotease [Cytophagaceae bacterium ABcell3]|nr:matrixin family metalloprotease [Cytophagaceae bacterium ABcell3]